MFAKVQRIHFVRSGSIDMCGIRGVVGVIRRTVSGALGLTLAFVGLSLFGYPFATEPSIGPPSFREKAITVAIVVVGIALGAAGIWLIRISLRREYPR